MHSCQPRAARASFAPQSASLRGLKVNVNKKCFQRAIENGEELEKNCESSYGTSKDLDMSRWKSKLKETISKIRQSRSPEMIVYAKKFMIGADRAATGSTRCGWSAGRCCTRRSTTLGFAWILRSEEYNDASSYGQEENEEVIEDGS